MLASAQTPGLSDVCNEPHTAMSNFKKSTFQKFLRVLQESEGAPPPIRDLIHPWAKPRRQQVEAAFRQLQKAVSARQPVTGSVATAQELGSTGESETDLLLSGLPGFTIKPAPGCGYPDRLLLPQAEAHNPIALEVKTSFQWDPDDTIRVVLASSTTKLRNLFRAAPINHLIVFLQINKAPPHLLTRVRLFFLPPDFEVNLRLEAHTNKATLNESANSVYLG